MVVVTVCVTFVIMVAEAQTAAMCLITREISDTAVTFSVEVVDQVYKQVH